MIYWTGFKTRRLLWGLALLVTCVALWWGANAWRDSLHDVRYLSGSGLFCLLLFLAGFNLRKRLPGLPLGDHSTWLQAHIYVALCTAMLGGVHIAWRFPQGALEQTLAGLYLLTMGSGAAGLYLTRQIPRRLRPLATQPLFEQIPSLLKEVAEQSRELIIRAAGRPGGLALVQFYLQTAAPFIELPRSWAYFFFPTTRRRSALLLQLDNLSRYLDAESQTLKQGLARQIVLKDDLDFHLAAQGQLKLWLFVHLPLTWLLLLLALFHGALAVMQRGF